MCSYRGFAKENYFVYVDHHVLPEEFLERLFHEGGEGGGRVFYANVY